jgi:hypothetical protein
MTLWHHGYYVHVQCNNYDILIVYIYIYIYIYTTSMLTKGHIYSFMFTSLTTLSPSPTPTPYIPSLYIIYLKTEQHLMKVSFYQMHYLHIFVASLLLRHVVLILLLIIFSFFYVSFQPNLFYL